MKNYNKKIYKLNEESLKYIQDDFIRECLMYAKAEANRFALEQTGILSRLDIEQEAYTALLGALERVNWDEVNELPVDERRAAVWAYVKKSFKLDLRKQINIKRDGIRACRMNGMQFDKEKAVQLVLVPEYFDNDKPIQYDSSYDVDRLGFALETAMGELLNYDEIIVLTKNYGIDTDKLSLQEIADLLGYSKRKVEYMKKEAIKKLKCERAIEIIQCVFADLEY